MKEGNLHFMEESEVDLTSVSFDLQAPAAAGKSSVKGKDINYVSNTFV